MLLREAKTKVIKLIREYSNAGNVIAPSKNLDYTLPMNTYFDTAQKLVATKKKINAKENIVQNSIDNLLGYQFSTNEHKTEDLNYSAIGAKSYYFEVSSDSTIYIEEETAPGVWTILDTIVHVNTSGVGFKSYKGLIVASDAENSIRLRFSGSFYYSFRYMALFEENFPSVDLIPNYQPYQEHELKSTFYQIDKVIFSEDDTELYNADYKFSESENSNVIVFRYDLKGEFEVYYYKYPDDVPNDDTNPNLYDDTYSFEIDIEAIEIMIMYVCYLVKSDEDPYIAGLFREEFYQLLNDFDNSGVTGVETVADSYGWV